tara:strand:- start:5559 stop:5792 length:234 start_codon:yes stop_codon:yes gene_type:complete
MEYRLQLGYCLIRIAEDRSGMFISKKNHRAVVVDVRLADAEWKGKTCVFDPDCSPKIEVSPNHFIIPLSAILAMELD